MLTFIKNSVSWGASAWFPLLGFPEGRPNPNIAGDILNKKQMRARAFSDIRGGLKLFDELYDTFVEKENRIKETKEIESTEGFEELLRDLTIYEAVKQIFLYGYSDTLVNYLKMVINDESVVNDLVQPTRKDFMTAVNNDPSVLDKTDALPIAEALKSGGVKRDVKSIHKSKYKTLCLWLNKTYVPPELLSKIIKVVWAVEIVSSAINRDDIYFQMALGKLTEYAEANEVPAHRIMYTVLPWRWGYGTEG